MLFPNPPPNEVSPATHPANTARNRHLEPPPSGDQMDQSNTTELFWSLIDKADRRFSRVRDLPNYGRDRHDPDFQKAFKIYTRLWKMQQEHRQKLMEAGFKRWEIGEIASRIAQLYYVQYQHTGDFGYLTEAYIFYEAVLQREYFRDGTATQEPGLARKQLRFIARFLIVCLVLSRRDVVAHLVMQLRVLVDECKRNFKETEFKEWRHAVQEIIRFLKVDTPFMNLRPLRYSFAYDPHPDSLSKAASCHAKRRLVLRDAIMCSYCHNEVKFTELTLDTFRMLQCLEWEPSGFFSLKGGGDSSHYGTGLNHLNPLQEIRDLTLPPNPRKINLFRPSITHFLMVLSTVCEELSSDEILLIYLSAAGESGFNLPVSLRSGVSPDTNDKVCTASPLSSPTDSPTHTSFQTKENERSNHEACLWLGARGTEGSNYLFPCDLIPFTRKPLFLIIDSNNSHAFKAIHGAEKGETSAMLLSPSSRAPAVVASNDSSHYQNHSQFTMFLTAPVQAFCFLVGISSMDIDKDKYNKAEKLFSLSLSEWETILVTSDSLHQVWAEVLGDPFLRRLLLRFLFCRAVLALYSPTFRQEGFQPACLPHLPEAAHPESRISQSAVMRLANFFDATSHFVFSEESLLPPLDSDETPVTNVSDINEPPQLPVINGC